MTRLKPREAVFHLREQLTGEPRRQRLIAFANERIAEASAINDRATGQSVKYSTIVDGNAGQQISQVRSGGTIVAIFAVHAAAIDFTWATLARLSPVDQNSKTVDNVVYRDNHLLLVNGDEKEAPVDILPEDVVTFVNLLPYARSIEQGSSKRQAPDGVYEVATAIIKAKVGNIVTVRFGYGSFTGAKADSNARYPFIELSPKRHR